MGFSWSGVVPGQTPGKRLCRRKGGIGASFFAAAKTAREWLIPKPTLEALAAEAGLSVDLHQNFQQHLARDGPHAHLVNTPGFFFFFSFLALYKT